MVPRIAEKEPRRRVQISYKCYCICCALRQPVARCTGRLVFGRAILLTWDVFCRVIDNFGDAGVCWRLARQLACEHGARVRLWVDGIASLARLCAGLDPARARQDIQSVEVWRWEDQNLAGITPAAVVVAAFGCPLPDAYMQAMASRHNSQTEQ